MNWITKITNILREQDFILNLRADRITELEEKVQELKAENQKIKGEMK